MTELLKHTNVFCEGLDHPEGLAVHPDGSIWAGGEAGQIYRIAADGSKIDQVADTGGFILGIAFSPAADWLAICDLGKKCVWKLPLHSMNLELFANEAAGHVFQIPNYAAFDEVGNLYLSDSGAFRQINGKILKLDPSGTGQIWHDGPFNFANGLALDGDGTHLYVVCSWLPGVERIEINQNGTAGKREVFVTLPKTVPDGLAFDGEGRLYISCYAPNRIYRVGLDGKVEIIIDDWEAHTLSNPTNMAFGGENFDQLFTTNLGRWHISRINLGTRGLPLPSHRSRTSR